MKKNIFYCLIAVALLSSCETMDGDISGNYNSNYVDENNPPSGEQYNKTVENPFLEVSKSPVSTFSIDADGASYTNVRRFINSNQTPPVDAIRTEEFINYFTYNYPDPVDGNPISINGEVSQCPWNKEHKLIRIGIKGKSIAKNDLPSANLVLLIDVSGSMSSPDKLELLKKGFISFANEMRPEDKIAIVTYAGQAGVLLGATSGTEKDKIIEAIKKLGAGGSTAGAKGIITAYEIAEKNFIAGGNNRVILGTDGDFNVGPSSQAELIKLIESKRDKGIFLTVLGAGTGNLNDGTMEQIADKGNGNYEYIDQVEQSDKVFIQEYSKFYTVAKDVKVQVTFSADLVESYRLIGYENRLLEQKDFDDDKKDAGEIGSGQTITALYEIKPKVNALFRQSPTFEIEFRFKNPNEEISKLISLQVSDEGKSFENASEDLRFASCAAGFGMLLRNSPYKGDITYKNVMDWAANAKTFDPYNYREGFINLVSKARK